jgi:hypothetical protein
MVTMRIQNAGRFTISEWSAAMAAAAVDVIGSSPITFTSSEGAQRFVPLSALQFNGSDLQLKSAWATDFDPSETTTLLAVAKTRAAAGELLPPPSPPPAPAIAFTAARTGHETNGITVSATAEHDKPPLTAKVTVTVSETDTYAGLATGDAAAHAIGVDAPTGNDGDPAAGTGLVVVKQGSTSASAKPATASSGVLKKGAPVDLKDEDSKVVLTLLPRADYQGTGGLSYAVTVDASGTTFTLSATYDSTKESGTQDPITIQTLGTLAGQVAYLVSASAPPSGAAVPADGSVQLSGGADGLAANGLLYT